MSVFDLETGTRNSIINIYKIIGEHTWHFFTSHWNNSLYDQGKNFFELKKVLLIQKNFHWSKEIDLRVMYFL